MRARTSGRAQASRVRVRDVALVVGRIEVLAVPAAGEDDSRPDPVRTVLVGQLARVFGVAGREAFAVAKAAMADAYAVVLRAHGVAGDHAEAGFEGCHFAVHGGVGHVVDLKG